MAESPTFKTLLDAAVTMGELSQGTAKYVHELFVQSGECPDGYREALEQIRASYATAHIDGHMPDNGGDAEPHPECFCPFCVSSRALQP